MNNPDKIPETTAEALALASRLQGNLSEKLALYRDQSGRLRPEFAAAYEGLVGHLKALEADKIGPLVGDQMPEFLLPDQQGQLISLQSLLASGPLVISLNRGHWCPYCKLDLRALAQIEPDIRRMGARLVSIMPETAKYTKKAIVENDFPFPVLTDVDLSYALSLGMIYWIGTPVKKLYDELGLDLELFQGNRSYFLPVAAKFIVDRDGAVRARAVNVDFRERMEPQAILAALRGM